MDQMTGFLCCISLKNIQQLLKRFMNSSVQIILYWLLLQGFILFLYFTRWMQLDQHNSYLIDLCNEWIITPVLIVINFINI